jgi:D-tyrosyl-tRNA(Tyr) deacylase
MKALIQRVTEARVEIGANMFSAIGRGLLVFLGVEREDNDADLDYLIRKVVNLRIFEDEKRRMNLSLQDIEGAVLVVSQFTLSADCRKGNRPSFDSAEAPHRAKEMYERFVERLKESKVKVSTGDFGAFMQVYLVNDGPVTIMLDSKK